MKTDSRDTLVDTNILGYCYDNTAPAKQERAIHVVDGVARVQAGLISTQVLSEFYNTLTRKLSPRMTAVEAERACREMLGAFWVWPTGVSIIKEAWRGVRRYGFNYWDALIWAAAREAAATTVLTEDFTDGSTIEGVTFLNPFTESFDLDALLAR